MQSAVREKKSHIDPILSSMKPFLLVFIAAFLLSRIRLHVVHAPLALGLLLAGELIGTDPFGMIGGIAIGAFLGDTPMWQELIVAVVFGIVIAGIRGLGKPMRSMMKLLVFSVIGGISLPLQLLNGNHELLYGVISLALSIISSFGFCKLMRTCQTIRIDRVLADSEQIAIAAAVGCVLVSISDIRFFGWSLSVMLLILLTQVVVTARGVYGAAASILWSSMLVLYAKENPLLIGCIAFAAFIASMLRTNGKPFVITAFLLSAVMFETYAQETALSMNTVNLLPAILLYILTPSQWIERLKNMMDFAYQSQITQNATITRIEQNASEEIERMGKLMYEFSGMFEIPSQYEDSGLQWLMQGALTICKGCEVRRICWKDAERMQTAILKLAETSETGKRPAPIEPIDANCRHFSDLCGSVLLAQRQAAARGVLYDSLKSQSGIVEKQFCGVGDALYGSAKRIRSIIREDMNQKKRILSHMTEAGMQVESLDRYETDGVTILQLVLKRPLHRNRNEVQHEMEHACGFRLRCVKTSVQKHAVLFVFEQEAQLRASMRVYRTNEGSDVSGDAAGECRAFGGRVCYALSDGMGRGKTARAESEAAIELLFRLYRAGMHKDLIYDNVNRLLMAKNQEETYATLDAVSIDLNTGEAEILKYGAPPSFLLRGGKVQIILGEALPCGILPEAQPSVTRMKLQTDDRLILCSDGVQDMLPEGTENALRSIEEAGSQTGEVLLKLAESRGGTDDMTVMVIRVA